MPDDPRSPKLAAPPKLTSQDNSLFLDFDGTLVEIANRPDGIIVDTALIKLLSGLAGTFQGRVALVSGRSIAQLDQLLGSALDGLVIVGSHGGEIRSPSVLLAPGRPDELVAAERALEEAVGRFEGVVLESKSQGIAAHFRLAPHAEPAVRSAVVRIAVSTGLTVQEGKLMLELRSSGHDKGTGIEALMAHPPFSGTTPVFVGDDVTDEAGFDAVTKLGGFGVLVGEMRATAAFHRLHDVSAVRAWLGAAT